MNTKIDPNASAFPIPTGPQDFPVPGITVRAHLASMAMQGLLANPSVDMNPEDLAKQAEKLADALIYSLNEGAE